MILSYGYEGDRAVPRNRRAAKAAAVVIAMLLIVGGCLALALRDWSGFTGSDARTLSRFGFNTPIANAPPLVLPVSAPESLRDVSRTEAERINAAIPISTAANPAAASLYIPVGDGKSFLRALDCMTSAVYYEAASESDDGLRAVAQVVLNRVRHPAFPNSVCGVVFEGSERRTGCQFSFTCDGSLARQPSAAGWARARRIAGEALAGRVFAPVGWSTHYHTDWVAPYWAPTLAKTAVVGAHIFYRWPGSWGQPRAFQQKYAGTETGDGLPLLPGQEAPAEALATLAETGAPSQERTVLPIDGRLPAGAVPLADMNKDAARPPARPTAQGGANRWVISAATVPARTEETAAPPAASARPGQPHP